MKKYILVSCVERELLIPDVFDTFNEANNQMMEEFRKALKYPKSHRFTISDNETLENEDAGFNEYSAWCESVYGDNCDWHIYEIEI